MKFGKAKYSGEYTQRKYFKLKDGEQIFRILPPMGEAAEKGIWSMFYNVHYGYKNTQGKMRAFQSSLVKNRKTKMVEVPDAALERIQIGKAKLEEAKKSGNSALFKQLDELFGQKGQYNLDNNHYVNAIDSQGNIGILKLRHRAKLALDATIKRLRETGVDPLDPIEGRWFVIRRSGMGLDTSFQVEILKEKIEVAGVGRVEKEVVHALTPDIVERLAKEAADLQNLFKRPTAQEIQRIVTEGALAVDQILDAKSDSGTPSGDDSEDYADDDSSEGSSAQSAAPAAAAPSTQQASSVSQPVSTPSSSTPAPQAAAPAPAPAAPVTAPATTAAAVTAQSDDEFLKSLGL